MKTNFVYHWTHRRLLRSILRVGLSPTRSEGKQEKIWVCGYERLAWALAHVAQHHGWNADDMVCIRIESKGVALQRTAMTAVYTSRYGIDCIAMDAVLQHVGDTWTPTYALMTLRVHECDMGGECGDD